MLSHFCSNDFKSIENSIEILEKQMKKNAGFYIDRNSIFTTLRDVIYAILIVIFLILFGNLATVILFLFPLGIALDHILSPLEYDLIYSGELSNGMKIFLSVSGGIAAILMFTTKKLFDSYSNSKSWRIYQGTTVIRAATILLTLVNAVILTSYLSSFFWNDPLSTFWLTMIVCITSQFFFTLVHLVQSNLLYLVFPVLIAFGIGFTWITYFAIFESNPYITARSELFVIWFILFVVINIIQSFGSTSIVHWVNFHKFLFFCFFNKRISLKHNLKYYAYRLRNAFYCKGASLNKNRMWNNILSQFSFDKDFGEQVCIKNGGPYPIIGVTLNDYRIYPQDPNYTPFFFGPLYSGSEVTKYTETKNVQIGLEKAMGSINIFVFFKV